MLRIRTDHFDCDNYSDQMIMINAPTLETLHLVNLEDKNLKWFISSRNKDKFPKLSTLIVQDSKISRNMYEALAAVFPSIENLTCINELEPALVMLRDYQGWSNISTISLWGDVNEQATNIWFVMCSVHVWNGINTLRSCVSATNRRWFLTSHFGSTSV